jgi:hypothetical protein
VNQNVPQRRSAHLRLLRPILSLPSPQPCCPRRTPRPFLFRAPFRAEPTRVVCIRRERDRNLLSIRRRRRRTRRKLWQKQRLRLRSRNVKFTLVRLPTHRTMFRETVSIQFQNMVFRNCRSLMKSLNCRRNHIRDIF